MENQEILQILFFFICLYVVTLIVLAAFFGPILSVILIMYGLIARKNLFLLSGFLIALLAFPFSYEFFSYYGWMLKGLLQL